MGVLLGVWHAGGRHRWHYSRVILNSLAATLYPPAHRLAFALLPHRRQALPLDDAAAGSRRQSGGTGWGGKTDAGPAREKSGAGEKEWERNQDRDRDTDTDKDRGRESERAREAEEEALRYVVSFVSRGSGRSAPGRRAAADTNEGGSGDQQEGAIGAGDGSARDLLRVLERVRFVDVMSRRPLWAGAKRHGGSAGAQGTGGSLGGNGRGGIEVGAGRANWEVSGESFFTDVLGRCHGVLACALCALNWVCGAVHLFEDKSSPETPAPASSHGSISRPSPSTTATRTRLH